ncbi:GNAT family N-acetyltransferase [Sphingomicrobium sediminis]|uniref:GNAT family N-acetyltransferase n=1 Tax=Sphingomicrobium sediminis TaxID=2950949 RepID=A0A9X2EHE7_9SPHN|nr:GNAT family N-acetyltransferase [Sphingomicrobium sediminis]MCM8556726.1 GNAT family N-acetyltransferase [Sphingomicrobium sediminis]
MFENGKRSDKLALFQQFTSPPKKPGNDRILDMTDQKVSGMLAHAAMRDMTKDVARDLLFAECFVETERLMLRPMRIEDFNDYAAMMGAADAFEFSDRGPLTRDEAYTRLLRQVGHWTLLDYGTFGVFERYSGEFVGEVGYGDFQRNMGDGFDGVPEACWTIAEAYRGQGYAQEAAHAALQFTEDRLIASRTVALIHEDNGASIHIARKLGYKPFGERQYRGYRAILFARQF